MSSIKRQIETCNQIISSIKSFTNDESLTDTVIPADTEILLAILDSTTIPPGTRNHIPRPLTRLSQSSLFTESQTKPTLASESKKEILSADRIDVLMSFIKWSGLRILANELKEFTSRPSTQGNVKVQETSGIVGVRCPAGSTKGDKAGKMLAKAEKWQRKGGFGEGNSRGPGGISEIRHKRKSNRVSETKEPESKTRCIGHSSDGFLNRGT